jgi:ribose/xylose/arabinose/galactoside ABC-type transport system permease subunit
MTAMTDIKAPGSSNSGSTRSIGRRIGWFFLDYGIVFALIIEIAIFALVGKEKFWNADVFAIILQTVSAVGIIQPFYTMSMISGIVDFGGAPLAAILFATLVTFAHVSWPIALLIGIGASLVIGLINAWVVIRIHIPPIVTTLITGLVIMGVAYLMAEKFGTAMQIKLNVPVLRQLWTVKPLGLPLTVYIMFALYIIVYILLNHTKLGAHLYAVGANPDAATRAGINYFRLFIFIFILLNIMTSMGNILYSVRMFNAGPAIFPNSTTGSGITLTLVASLFAGIGLFGGSGRVEFTLVGLLFFGVLIVGMSVVGFPAQYRVAVDGFSILAALMLDALRRYLISR